MLVKYPIMGLSYAHGYFAICGGGGSLKSGIKNTVDIYQLSDTDPSGFTKDISVETGTELASGVAFSHDGLLIAVSVNSACWLYELDKKEKTMKLLVKFRTDFAADESSQSCACFVGNSTILTGGEDGIVRVWRLNREPTATEKAVGTAKALDCSSSPSSPSKSNHNEPNPAPPAAPTVGNAVISDTSNTLVTLTREYRGHTKRIRDLHVDASHRNLVVSSSEDQTCHIWRLTEDAALFKFSKDDALDIAFEMLKTKPLAGPRKHQFRCARFANDGRRLYTVLTPARGDSILIKWKPATIAQTSEAQWQWVVESCAIAGDKPVASLCVSQDDNFVCTAAVSGDIKVFTTSNLQPYTKVSTEQHSFAITGMSFAFANNAESKQKCKVFHLISGGADKNLLRHDIPFEGGEIISGAQKLVGGVQMLVKGGVRLVLSSFMAATLLYMLLLFIHAKEAMLMDGPCGGFEDLMGMRFDSPDALVAFGASLLSVLLAWAISQSTSVKAVFFSNGFLCLIAALGTFFVAVSPELELHWKTGDAAFDELLGEFVVAAGDLTISELLQDLDPLRRGVGRVFLCPLGAAACLIEKSRWRDVTKTGFERELFAEAQKEKTLEYADIKQQKKKTKLHCNAARQLVLRKVRLISASSAQTLVYEPKQMGHSPPAPLQRAPRTRRTRVMTMATKKSALMLVVAAAAVAALTREAHGLQFTDVRMSEDDTSSKSSSKSAASSSKSKATSTTKFTAEAAAALAKVPSNASVTEWTVSDGAADQATSGGYVTGNWTTLDTKKYTIKACAPQVWNVTKQKVTSLWLRFDSIEAPGDQVIVSKPDGSLAQTFDDSPSGVTTNPIAGKTLKIEFRPSANKKTGCAATGVLPTMKVDAVGFQWSKEMLVVKENICGAKDTMKNAICANSGSDIDRAIYVKSRAVVRTERTREDGALVTCTAWLWGNKGHLVSNHHCFSSQDMVDKSRFQFLVETAQCDGKCNPGSCPVAQVIVGKGNVQFIKSDANLDFAVLKITNNPVEYVNKYGYMKIRFGSPTKGEEIYIPQHPYGGPKKIAMTDDDADKATATIKDTNYQIKMSGQTYSNLIGYSADTAAGSSGSPVVSKKNHLVVGLHRIGDCNNAATASNFLVAPLLAISSDNDGFSQ